MEHTEYKIAVVTNTESNQSLDELKHTASLHRVHFDQIRFPFLALNDFEDSELLIQLEKYDIVYYRTGMRDTVIDELALVLQKKDIPLINGSQTHPGIHKKIQQALIAGRFGIPHPKSYLVDKFNYTVASSLLGENFVVKPDVGAHGTEVSLVSSAEELAEIEKNRSKDKYIFQELITDADEYRIYTIGNKGIASYKKIPAKQDFRANLHAGGGIEKTEPEREKQLLAFGGHVASCFGADISGVDILYKDNKCILLELNWQPGWEQLDEVSGVNFSEETIQHILNLAHQHKLKRKLV